MLATASGDPAAIEFVVSGSRRNLNHGTHRVAGKSALFTVSDHRELGVIEAPHRMLSMELLRRA